MAGGTCVDTIDVTAGRDRDSTRLDIFAVARRYRCTPRAHGRLAEFPVGGTGKYVRDLGIDDSCLPWTTGSWLRVVE
ncbi:hypothetical protein [Mycobacterium sp.]|uniref:hypothetical protein n=1 Tax=Mycobacterium sp. TaxID=1785 RepID=UPI002B8385D3|nr:hypothetical protein [Mycobacterium sp.]HKP39724.1 hypothetical protein [Mycobacterium sp.]